MQILVSEWAWPNSQIYSGCMADFTSVCSLEHEPERTESRVCFSDPQVEKQTYRDVNPVYKEVKSD